MEPAAPRPAPDLFDRLDALFASQRAQIVWLAAFTLFTRAAVFGQSAYFNDESFYWQIGLRMHDGLLPYVDIWDRKGPGLFLVTWLIGFFSSSVLAFQIGACAFAAATAWVLARLALHFTGALGAVLAGSLYLVMTAFLGGAGGQSPMFYNLFVALAALAVVRALPQLDRGQAPVGLFLAMVSAGFALTFKQTAMFEGAFLGLFALWRLARGAMPLARLARTALVMALAGALPFLVFGLLYAAAGHFGEFWQAMVTANLRKSYDPGGDHWVRLGALATLFAAVWIPALAGLAAPLRAGSPGRLFLAGWLAASLAGFFVVPNFYEHYLLPLCLPFCLAAAAAFGWGRIGKALGLVVLTLMVLAGGSLDFARGREARAAMTRLADDIRARDPQPRPLIYQGPIDLYRQFGAYPASPLYFTLHLYFPAEDNVSQFDTAEAVRRILAANPREVLVYHAMAKGEENPRTSGLVRGYAAQRCRFWFTRRILEARAERFIDVYGDCHGPPSAGTSGR